MHIRNSRFGRGTQEDSHEALRCLLFSLRQEEIKVRTLCDQILENYFKPYHFCFIILLYFLLLHEHSAIFSKHCIELKLLKICNQYFRNT